MGNTDLFYTIEEVHPYFTFIATCQKEFLKSGLHLGTFFLFYDFYHTSSKTVQNNFYEVRKAVLPVLSGKLLKTSHVLNTSLRLSYLLESNTVKKTSILWNLLQSTSGWSLTRASLSERGIPSRARRVKNRERKDEKTF